MAYEGGMESIVGLKAAADLGTQQFKAVKMSGDFAVDVCSVAGERAIGILQDNPALGHGAMVCKGGVCKALLGATVSASGLPLQVDVAGKLIPAVSGKNVVALSLHAGAANDIASVLVQPGNEVLA